MNQKLFSENIKNWKGRLTKTKRLQMANIRNDVRDIATDPTGIKR